MRKILHILNKLLKYLNLDNCNARLFGKLYKQI